MFNLDIFTRMRLALEELDQRYPRQAPFSVTFFNDGSGHVDDTNGNRVSEFSNYDNHVTDGERAAAIYGVKLDA